MNLHNDQIIFDELLRATSDMFHIPVPIIEKDYYVTLVLKELTETVDGMVFKGGTSLTKCYQLLNRFSEDIDISYLGINGNVSDGKRKKLKRDIVNTMEKINLPVKNLDSIRSRRNYNCYQSDYPSIYEGSYLSYVPIRKEIIIETYIALLPFPTEVRLADNYIYRYLKNINQEEIATKFDIAPFLVTTQTAERTFVDKVFAICDYYLQGDIDRHSRHLYDIYMILKLVNLDDFQLITLIKEIRKLREPLKICPSAKQGVQINKVLHNIIKSDVYKDDYNSNTSGLLFVKVPYNEVIIGLEIIVKSNIFNG